VAVFQVKYSVEPHTNHSLLLLTVLLHFTVRYRMLSCSYNFLFRRYLTWCQLYWL